MSKKKSSAGQPVNTASVRSLIELIRSLTQSQKRDFKKFAQFYGRTEGRKYLQLFDAVNRYLAGKKSEKDLTAFLLTIPVFKTREVVNAQARYLFDKILLSVRTLPEAQPRQQRLHGVFQDINFLYHKGLLQECTDLVEE